MATKICSRCKAEILNSAKFCNQCGNDDFLKEEKCSSCGRLTFNPLAISNKAKKIIIIGAIDRRIFLKEGFVKIYSCGHFAHIALITYTVAGELKKYQVCSSCSQLEIFKKFIVKEEPI